MNIESNMTNILDFLSNESQDASQHRLTRAHKKTNSANAREHDALPYPALKNTVVPTVNFHLFKPCDAKCRFCFATFRDINSRLPLFEAWRLLEELAAFGVRKITFAGGEPTLHPHISALILKAKSCSMTTSIVTNGSKLAKVIEEVGDNLDFVTLSVDSADERIQQDLGRGRGDHVAKTMKLAALVRERGIRLKVNTVVTALSVDEDMSDYLRELSPERWKAFQVLAVEGQNDGDVEDLLISSEQFEVYMARHLHLERSGIVVVPEDNDAMTDSYAMIDPLGRFFGNSNGSYRTSAPVLEIGVEAALLEAGYSYTRLVERGGVYE